MRLYSPIDSTGNLIMIEKLVFGETWSGDLPIFSPDALTSAPSRYIRHDLQHVPILERWTLEG